MTAAKTPPPAKPIPKQPSQAPPAALVKAGQTKLRIKELLTNSSAAASSKPTMKVYSWAIPFGIPWEGVEGLTLRSNLPFKKSSGLPLKPLSKNVGMG